MKASVLTLDGARNFIPAALRQRYSDDFLVAIGNEVLGDIEQECDPDYFRGEFGLLLLDGITDYALDSSIRHIRGIYEVPAGDVIPDREHPFAFEVLGSKLRLKEVPIFNEDDADITGTTPAGTYTDRTVVKDTTAGKLDSALDEDELQSRLLILTHVLSGVKEYRILRGNTPDDFTADLNGELDSVQLVNDTYRVTVNFLILEHTRYLSRFTAKTSVLPLSQDFEKLLRIGLTFKYHFQADEMSREATEWQQKYQDELDRFRIDTTKPRGMAPRNRPRSLPSLFE